MAAAAPRHHPDQARQAPGRGHPHGRRAGPCGRGLSGQADPRRASRSPSASRWRTRPRRKKRGSKSIVRRDIVRVVTPGTLTEDGLLDARGRQPAGGRGGARRAGRPWPAVELSTGAVDCRRLRHRRPGRGAGGVPAVRGAGPRPPVLRRRELKAALKAPAAWSRPWPRPWPNRRRREARVKRLYGVATLDGFGAFEEAEVSALGLIAAHLETTQAGKLPALSPPRRVGRGRRSWPSTRPPGSAWRSTAPSAASARARCWPASTARSPRAGRGLWPSGSPGRCSIPAAIDARLDAVDWLLERRVAAARSARRAEGARPTWRGPCRGWRWAAAGRAIWPPSAPA